MNFLINVSAIFVLKKTIKRNLILQKELNSLKHYLYVSCQFSKIRFYHNRAYHTLLMLPILFRTLSINAALYLHATISVCLFRQYSAS